VLVPVAGTVTWKLAAGDFEFYRWRISELEYDQAALARARAR
jgi:hypothetical protein